MSGSNDSRPAEVTGPAQISRRAWRRAPVLLGLVLGAALPLTSATAAAQASGAPAAVPGATQIARDLFERGKAKWAAGQYEEAAALLAASNQQVPKAGTSMLLGDAYEHLGRLRSARDTFRRASELARQSGESQLEYRANTREAALLPRVPQVQIRVAAPVPPGLLVTLNGREVPASELNVATALDAGTYLLEAHAPDHEPFSARLELSNDAPQAGVRVVSVHLVPRGEHTEAPAGSGRETLAWWIGGAGAALTAASLVTLIVALDKNAASEDECGEAGGAVDPDENACNARGVELRDDARTLANVATVGGILGLAGIGAGLTLHFTAPDRQTGSAVYVGYSGAF
jgi:tetratricopeptide (TPR) repeat protein